MAQELELGGYQIEGRLAVGGMAEVFQARAAGPQRNPDEPEVVVLKRLHPRYRNEAAFVKQFVDEAKLTMRFGHPHLVRTYRWFKLGLDYLIVQELVSGRTLGFMMDAFAKAGVPMPPTASTYVAWCLAKALDYVHHFKVGEGSATIVHRDVNPENILLSVTGDVKLTDFGVAEVEGMMRGEAGALRGTVAYMSPEAVLGQPVDHRADLYSLGIVLWELYANRRLFHLQCKSDVELMHRVRDARIPKVTAVNPDVPEFAAQIVRRALFADRALRFQTAGELTRALEALARREGWPLGVDALRPLLGG